MELHHIFNLISIFYHEFHIRHQIYKWLSIFPNFMSTKLYVLLISIKTTILLFFYVILILMFVIVKALRYPQLTFEMILHFQNIGFIFADFPLPVHLTLQNMNYFLLHMYIGFLCYLF